MNLSPGAPDLDPCGCCEADPAEVPLYNRPGLSALAYRIGTHPVFLQRMLSRLATEGIPNPPAAQQGIRPLAALTTRATDDPSIALLDAWATVADVVTFYQERIANEGFLRTATERRSVLELARAIGYELNPGVAASTFLAFTVETAPGSPGAATIAQGTKVQSVPGQDQRPQTFETIEIIQTRAEWNALRVQQSAPQDIAKGITQIYLQGVTTQLQPGDGLLIVGNERDRLLGASTDEIEKWDFRILESVTLHSDTEDPAKSSTLVTWKKVLGGTTPPANPAATNIKVFALRQRAALFGFNAPDWRVMPNSVKQAYNPNFDPNDSNKNNPGSDWPDFEIRTVAQKVIDLDAPYPKVLAGSWLVLRKPGWVELYKAKQVSTGARTDFTLTGKTTHISLDVNQNLEKFGLRETVVCAQSEEVALAERPLDDPVHGDAIVLDRLVSGLAEGQTLIVGGRRLHVTVAGVAVPPLASPDGSQHVALSAGDRLAVMEPPVRVSDGRRVPLAPGDLVALMSGSQATSVMIGWSLMDRDGFVGSVTAPAADFVLQPADEADPTIYEVAAIKTITPTRDRTSIALHAHLLNSYDRATVAITANVARATHGETVKDEVLGGGDGASVHQQFSLKKPPLTYISAATASGAKSTLAVRVNRVLWEEAPSLYGLDATRQAYIVRIDDAGRPAVLFGDGEQGARLPTGQENIKATYRSGSGAAGMVAAGSLTLLQTRPLGIRGVTNPLAARGGADRESLADARTNAPLTVLTLDRIVSLRDCEDFARAFAGIGKARATALWNGERQIVHLTIAASNGDEGVSTSDLCKNLVAAIDAHRDPGLQVEVASFRRCTFSLAADIRIDPRFVIVDVTAQVKEALSDAFAFGSRTFGQPVTSAEIITVVQGTEGVIAVDLNQLYADPPCGTGPPAPGTPPPAILPARAAQHIGEISDLLVVNPGGITLGEMPA